MKLEWSWRRAPAHSDRFMLYYGANHVGDVWWLIDISPGHHYALDRICGGLNGTIAGEDGRTWSVESDGTPLRWSINHNGRQAGDLTWMTEPAAEPELLLRVITGLNYVESRHLPPPAPAAPRRPVLPPDAMVTHDGRPMKYQHGDRSAYVIDKCRCPRCTATAAAFDERVA